MPPAPEPARSPDRSASGSEPTITRKNLLKTAVAVGIGAPLVAAGAAIAKDERSSVGTGGIGYAGLSVTPACHDGDQPTIPEIEGPYFKPNSPLRTSLVDADTVGLPLTVTGFVYGLACQPIAGALLDFWQADDGGNYDNTGFTFRGHQFTDANGAFTLSTIVPGLYPGRTRHIHVKAQAPGQPILTTQLYFPGEPENASDAYYDDRLLLDISQVDNGEAGTFGFVLDVAQNGPPPTSPPPTSPTTPPSSPPSSPPPAGSWKPGVAYTAGQRVTYNGVSYVCIQGHTSMVGWEPPAVPALWQPA